MAPKSSIAAGKGVTDLGGPTYGSNPPKVLHEQRHERRVSVPPVQGPTSGRRARRRDWTVPDMPGPEGGYASCRQPVVRGVRQGARGLLESQDVLASVPHSAAPIEACGLNTGHTAGSRTRENSVDLQGDSQRRGGDSNPRTRSTPVTRFPVAPVQPLRHLSERPAEAYRGGRITRRSSRPGARVGRNSRHARLKRLHIPGGARVGR
jgi:hypothetical protein